jgi:hypothetical protein
LRPAWGCPGTDEGHVPHRLVGRGVSNATAALELALIGQYDESLAMSRSVGELANLLWLFCADTTSMGTWRALEPKARWSAFRPPAVRRKLKHLRRPLLVEEEEYSLLSELGVHVTPGTHPNALV